MESGKVTWARIATPGHAGDPGGVGDPGFELVEVSPYNTGTVPMTVTGIRAENIR